MYEREKHKKETTKNYFLAYAYWNITSNFDDVNLLLHNLHLEFDKINQFCVCSIRSSVGVTMRCLLRENTHSFETLKIPLFINFSI